MPIGPVPARNEWKWISLIHNYLSAQSIKGNVDADINLSASPPRCPPDPLQRQIKALQLHSPLRIPRQRGSRFNRTARNSPVNGMSSTDGEFSIGRPARLIKIRPQMQQPRSSPLMGGQFNLPHKQCGGALLDWCPQLNHTHSIDRQFNCCRQSSARGTGTVHGVPNYASIQLEE